MDSWKVRKSAMTLTSVVLAIVATLLIFTATFNWWNTNSESAGVPIDTRYNDTKRNLTTAQTSLDNNIQDIRTNLVAIKEADNTWQVALNGLKGLGNTLKLPIAFVSSAVDTSQAMFISLDVIPKRIIVLVTIGIIAFTVFLILSILKGDPTLT